MPKLAPWLAGGAALLTGIVGVFGVASGDLGRVARNHPVLFAVLLGTGLLAITLGVLVASTSTVSNVVLAVAVLALSVVTVWISVLVATDESAKEGPAVAGGLAVTKDQLTITGSARVGGLKSNEHLLVEVKGRATKTHALVPIYSAIVGPDSDGKVDSEISTVAAAGRYDAVIVQGTVGDEVPRGYVVAPRVASCSETVRYRGCAILTVPQTVTKPAKSASKTKKSRSRQ